MADKDESTSDAVTIDTNPGNLFAHPPLRMADKDEAHIGCSNSCFHRYNPGCSNLTSMFLYVVIFQQMTCFFCS